MKTIENLIEELNSRGFISNATTINKNGVEMKAINMRRTPDQKICHVVYVDRLLEDETMSVKETADFIERQIEGKESIDIGDPSLFLQADYLKANCYIAFQKKGSQDLIKRVSDIDENIDEYLYIKQHSGDGENFTIKITPQIVDKAGIDIDELWKAAEANTYTSEEFNIKSLGKMIAEMSGFEVDEMPDLGDIPSIFVLSNKDLLYGSSQLNNPLIKKWAKSHGYNKLLIIFSSIHEILIIPADEEEISLDQLEVLIGEVNSSTVAAEEQLGDKPLIINL